MSKNTIKWIKENKCQTEGCYNYSERGYILCVNHLHGFPQKIDDEDIERLKNAEVEELAEKL